MERLLYKDGTVWRHTGTATQHIAVLNIAADLYQAKLRRVGWRRKNGHDLRAIRVCWDSGLLNLTHLSEITGVTRLTLRQWVGDDGYGRPKGRVNPEHLSVLAQYMENMGQSRYSRVNTGFLDNLANEGTKHAMSRILLGINDRNEVAISYVRDDVLPGVRPDDPGYLVQSQEGVAAVDPDQADDGHPDGEGQPEPDQPGVLQGPAPRPPAAKPGSAALDRLLTQHRRVDAPQRRADDEGLVDDQGWDPTEGFNPDKDGDSLLERGKHTPASGLLDAIPVGEPWKQATPES